MTNRLFVGLDLPQATKDYIAEQRNKIYGKPNVISWESDENQHITLKFLGDVGENITELICDRFDNILATPIEAEFSNFNFFKKNDKLKILYLGLKDSPKITNLFSIIEDECELLGFPKEKRKFKPHLTLLRVRENTDKSGLEKFNSYNLEHGFIIDSFSLFKSELENNHSKYTVLRRFKLI